MSVNSSKGNVIHSRPNSVPRVDFDFTCGAQSILIADKFTYLGITLNKFLDFSSLLKLFPKVPTELLDL